MTKPPKKSPHSKRPVATVYPFTRPQRASPIRLIRPSRLAELFDIHISTVWRWERDGILPAPVEIGGIKGWTETQLKQLIDEHQPEAVEG